MPSHVNNSENHHFVPIIAHIQMRILVSSLSCCHQLGHDCLHKSPTTRLATKALTDLFLIKNILCPTEMHYSDGATVTLNVKMSQLPFDIP